MTHISLTQFETRHRQIEAELEREHALAAGRCGVEIPRRHRWFRAVRGAAAA